MSDDNESVLALPDHIRNEQKHRAEEARQMEFFAEIKELGDAAVQTMRFGVLKPAGYRILVKLIEVKTGLEGLAAENAPTLADKGFQQMTDKEREKHEKGQDHGVVLALGPLAYQRMGADVEPWCKKGDVIAFTRYAGKPVEHPVGSKIFFQIINDDDVFGVIE
ncbi:MAG: hypothetical protein ACR2PR_11635 [Pseudohongiellaceae bacterium]